MLLNPAVDVFAVGKRLQIFIFIAKTVLKKIFEAVLTTAGVLLLVS